MGESLNVSRNVGMVLVNRDFPSLPRPQGANWLTDDLILSSGSPAEEGGFYDFNGGWQPQRNVGVVWLTDYDDLDHNASRIKAHPMGEDRILILWELWRPYDYVHPRHGGDPAGAVVTQATALHAHRLGWRDDPFALRAGWLMWLITAPALG